MTGDASDMVRRLKAVLPARWFPDSAPLLEGLLTGLADAWAWLYSLLQYARQQTRIATATDGFLDLIAQDCFGGRLVRASGQTDAAFRAIIQREMLRERGTRAAVVSVLTDLTGRAPVVFEPARPADTGGWGLALGYGAGGGWGNLGLPFQCFVTAFRPGGAGIPTVAGWGAGAGGYGAGAVEYASLSMLQGAVTDSDINAAIAGVMPVAAIAWTRISS
jgi:hypothetical protein